jgi:hypothetical protein
MEDIEIRYELFIEYAPERAFINRKPYQSCATQEKAEYIAKRDLKGRQWIIVKTERTVVSKSTKE